MTEEEELPPFDAWKFVYEELESLSRQTEEGEEDLFLFEALLNDSKSLLALSKREDVVIRFLASYPSVLWLLERIGPGIWKIYVTQKQIEKIREMKEEYVPAMIPFIREREVARLLIAKNPKVSIKDSLYRVASQGKIGETLWLLEKSKKINPPDWKTIVNTENKEVILSLWEKLTVDDQMDVLYHLAEKPLMDIFSSLLLENIPNENVLLNLATSAFKHPESLKIIIPLFSVTTDLTIVVQRALYSNKIRNPDEIMKWIGIHRVDTDKILYNALRQNNDVWIYYFFPLANIDQLDDETVLLVIENGKTEILKKILATPNFIPPHETIIKAYDKPEILSLLLADGRADPAANGNHALHLVLRGIINSYRFDEDSIYNYEDIYKQSLALLLGDERIIQSMDSVSFLLDLVKLPSLFKRIYEAKPVTSSHQIQNLTIAAVTNGSIDVVLYLLPLVYKPEDVLAYALMSRKREMAEAVLDQYPELATEKVLEVLEKMERD